MGFDIRVHFQLLQSEIYFEQCLPPLTSRSPIGPFGLESFSWTRQYLLIGRTALTYRFCSVTEILDVAPLDVFSGLSKHFVDTLPMELLTDEQRAQALDVDFHWVSESGQSGQLTAGATIVPTVKDIKTFICQRVLTRSSTPLRTALHSTLR